jgi:hypothetical protein
MFPAGVADVGPAQVPPTKDVSFVLKGRTPVPSFQLTARVATDGDKFVEATRAVRLTCRYCGLRLEPLFPLDPGGATAYVVKDLDLTVLATALDESGQPANPPADPTKFTWSVGAEGKLSAPVPVPGTSRATAKGLAFGPTTLTATWDDGCETRAATLPVKVVGIEISKPLLQLQGGQVGYLSAVNSIPNYPCSFAWYSVGNAVALYPEGADSSSVRVVAGHLPDATNVTVACGDHLGSARVEVGLRDAYSFPGVVLSGGGKSQMVILSLIRVPDVPPGTVDPAVTAAYRVWIAPDRSMTLPMFPPSTMLEATLSGTALAGQTPGFGGEGYGCTLSGTLSSGGLSGSVRCTFTMPLGGCYVPNTQCVEGYDVSGPFP